MTLQVENLRQTYGRTYDNLMTNRKIFLCNLAPGLSDRNCKHKGDVVKHFKTCSEKLKIDVCHQ